MSGAPPDETTLTNFSDWLATSGLEMVEIAAIASAVAALLSVAVATVALAISAYNARRQRAHDRASVRPLIDIEGINKQKQRNYSLVNHGTGPAIIESIDVLIDGEPLPRTGDERFDALQLYGFPDKFDMSQSYPGDGLGSGQSLLLIEVTQPMGGITWARLGFNVVYHSVYGERFERIYEGGWHALSPTLQARHEDLTRQFAGKRIPPSIDRHTTGSSLPATQPPSSATDRE